MQTIKECEHKTISLIDEYFTCLKCGLTFEDFAFCDTHYQPKSWANLPPNVARTTFHSLYCNNDFLSSDKSPWYEDLLTRLLGLHDFNIIPLMVEQNIRTLLSSSIYEKKRNRSYLKDQALIAHAIYSTCLKFSDLLDSAISVETLLNILNIKAETFWSVHDEFIYENKKFQPSNGLNRIKQYLNLTYAQMQHIAKFSDSCADLCSNKPNVVLACCIFLYLSKLGHKISVRKSAEICQVSATSVNNLKNKIKKDLKFKLCIKTFLTDY